MMLSEVDDHASLDIENIPEIPSAPTSNYVTKKPEPSLRPPTWGHKPTTNTSVVALSKTRNSHQDHSPSHINSNKTNRLSNKVSFIPAWMHLVSHGTSLLSLPVF